MSPVDTAMMARALELAQRGRGGTSPNPMVGAVVVKDGVVIAEGWHRRAGEGHAEANALEAAGDAARGATLYVTLEPCCHRGQGKRRPPCTDAVLASGVARVVVAAVDPNPAVAGQGLELLRAAGLAVESGVLGAEAAAMNVAFAHWIGGRMPWVRLKLAQSVDGRIARREGVRHWVTSEAARARVHRMRADADAVMVGSRTALVDDPRLTVRDVPGDWLAPLRVVVDSALAVPATAAMYGADPGGACALTAVPEGDPRAEALRARGVEVVSAPGPDGRVELARALAALGARAPRPITSILVEGGGGLAAALLERGLVHELVVHQAPVAYGAGGVPAIGALASDARLELQRAVPLGPDLELTYAVRGTA